MIARVWRGATRAEDAEAYAAYIEESGTGPSRKLAGARVRGVALTCAGGRAQETMLGEPTDELAAVLEIVTAILEIGRVDEVPDQLQTCHNLC